MGAGRCPPGPHLAEPASPAAIPKPACSPGSALTLSVNRDGGRVESHICSPPSPDTGRGKGAHRLQKQPSAKWGLRTPASTPAPRPAVIPDWLAGAFPWLSPPGVSSYPRRCHPSSLQLTVSGERTRGNHGRAGVSLGPRVSNCGPGSAQQPKHRLWAPRTEGSVLCSACLVWSAGSVVLPYARLEDEHGKGGAEVRAGGAAPPHRPQEAACS